MNNSATYLQTIQSKYPKLSIKDVEFNQEGQNNDIAIINKETIFRFPKYPAAVEELKKETFFLTKMHDKLPVAIPNPTYVSLDSDEVGAVFTGYRLIEGKPLSKEVFDTIKDQQALADQLAGFLKELHGLQVDQELLDVLQPAESEREIWADLYARIRKKLFDHMSEESRESVAENFETYLSAKEHFENPQTVIHGDFGPTNLLYDREAGRISGIIDFGSVSIGDPALDLASLRGPFGFGENFIKKFASVYPEVESYLERARFYASTFALQAALFGIENGDDEAFESGIEPYRRG